MSGSTFSLAPSASAIVINGVTSALYVTPSPVQPSPILTINSQTVTPNSASAYIVSSQTLAPGSTAITVGGTTYPLAPSASAIVLNGQTSSLSLQQAAQVFSINSQPVTAILTSASAYIIGTQTLVPGGPPITIDNAPMSLAPSGSSIIVGGQTQSLAQGSSAPLLLTIGSQTLTELANPALEYIVGSSQTLIPGAAAIQISGVAVSLMSSATAMVVVAGSTESFTSPTAAAKDNNGSAYAGPGFTAKAERLRAGFLGCWGEMALDIGFVALLLA